MKILNALLSFFCLANLALCQSVFITYPSPGSVFSTGDTVLIEWQKELNSTTDATYVTIALSYGDRNNLTICHVMSDRAVLNLGYYQWIIPPTIETRSDYVFEVGTDSDDIAFDGYITINKRNFSTTTKANSQSTVYKAYNF
ncbi:MAG: hypothetical protein EXX96DRAFT_638165 [Benjaminiella poitrasii]|nr:MAG: hypothetical protein EXX96DRAFT_638165 [Benjaminiella poitrasii]